MQLARELFRLHLGLPGSIVCQLRFDLRETAEKPVAVNDAFDQGREIRALVFTQKLG